MTGRENDIKIATVLRDNFISKYNDTQVFNELLDTIKEEYEERFVHRATKECKLNVIVHYNTLKEMVAETRKEMAKDIFEKACLVNEARTWINDNGRYKDIVSEAFYQCYKVRAVSLK